MPQTLLPPSIETADLTWHDGVPESTRFGDVYFSRDNGLAETRYVFIEHNQLAERFSKLPKGEAFVIAETGFGTGLNFLAAWQTWRQQAPDHASTLHFVSVERFPLTRPDLSRALALWPELAPLAEQLIAQYPPLTHGVHRILFDGGRVRLTLYLGDMMDAWDSLNFQADAWFLDGFAPARNPDMWLDQAMARIRHHSKPGTTLATFTAVGRIRRALESVGFDMRKTPGFGRKRDMLVGSLPIAESPGGTAPQSSSERIVIVGAGIAGCLLARNLAERGLDVTLLDSDTEAGSGASGNFQGATYIKLGVDYNDQSELALTALTFTQRYYNRFRDQHWHPTGLLQLAWSEQEQDRQRRFLERNHYPIEVLYPVDQQRASELTGVATATGGLWFPGSGWLEPARLCAELADHPNIRKAFGVTVGELEPAPEGWRIEIDEDSPLIAKQVVLCAGHLTPQLIPIAGAFKLKSIRGQVTHLNAADMTNPNAVICGPRYLNPAHQGQALTGATFDLRDNNPEPTSDGHHENLSALAEFLPGVVRDPSDQAKIASGRVSFRCATHDYQPVADELCDAAGQRRHNLYLFTGLGSKGLTYAPLLAEYLADRLSGQPQCLPGRLIRRLASSRVHQPES